MAGTGIKRTVAVKIVFCSLYYLLAGYGISVFVKEIGFSVYLLPAGIFVFSRGFADLAVKFFYLVIIRILGLPELSVGLFHIQYFPVGGL